MWICKAERGHIQATGRDARGRKQYRYHAKWREHRDANKYERMVEFGHALGRIRAEVDRHLALPGLPREKILATVVRLLELTHARVGNDEYTKTNGSYGLTTLESRHVEVEGSIVTFRFRGKSGVKRVLGIKDARLARIVRRCDDLPGQRLFEYLDDEDEVHTIDSSDVNDYIRQASGGEFSAKDFRTLAGTVLAARRLRDAPKTCASRAELQRVVRGVLEDVSKHLGNTVAVCRRCYVHPAVLDAYERSSLQTDGTPASDESDDRESEEDRVLRQVARFRLADTLVETRQ